MVLRAIVLPKRCVGAADCRGHCCARLYTAGQSDAATTKRHRGRPSEDMGKSSKAQAKEPELAISDVPPTQSSQGEGLGKLYVPRLRGLKNRSCSALCTRILYVTFALITAVQSVAVIAVTVTAALATKIYSDDLSGRLVAMVVLAVTAAVTISVGIYAAIGAIRKQRKPVHSASMVLAVVVVIQAIILGMAVRVTVDDEVKLGRSLSESFRLSRDDSPRHVKLWARTQHDLSCCGVYSAEDYRSANLPLYFAPNVPISCCASYDPGRSELVQERERESCKARKEYYDVGCRNLIIDVFKDTAKSVLGVSLLAVVLEILCILIGIILSIQSKPKPEIDCERQAPAVVTTTEKKTKSKS
ncbi:unnamed protein product, partial [Iphiclides podalirius]